MTRDLIAAVGMLVGVAITVSSCGYALAGRGNALPTYIQTIGVPQFANQSTEPDIDLVLTDKVREEFQGKGQYLVRPDESDVDGLFTATIVSVQLQPTGFTADRQPSSYVIVVVANVEFTDVIDDGRVIWANPSFRVTDEYQVASGGPLDPTAIFAQNTQARDRVAMKFAREVVASIFEAF
jgi:hypothetical protein